MLSKRLAPVASALSSALAILCPLCIPALGALLTSIGLGFALKVEFLRSLLVILLLLSLGSLTWSVRIHRKWWVLFPGFIGAAFVYAGRYIWFSVPVMVIGAAVLIGVSLANLKIKLTCDQCEKK